jgi:kynurenine formamidase
MTRVIVLCALLAPLAVAAQTRQSGPWWPNAEWGPMDQAGASNRITPAKIMQALSVVRTGQVYEVGRVYEAGMPIGATRSYSLSLLATAQPQGGNRVVYNDEFVAGQVGQVGTQFDGLGHIGGEVKFQDGTVDRVFYNGFTAAEMNASSGLRQLGVEHVKPIITRGVLIDLPRFKGVGRLERGYEVTLADVRGALARQRIAENSITPGDAVLFRYGWAQLWSTPAEYGGSTPGIGVEVARWLVERKVTVTGADTAPTEVSPNPNPNLVIPVHQELMMKNGIFNIENMTFEELAADEVYEFLFIATPIRYKGATGSPMRPLAIR